MVIVKPGAAGRETCAFAAPENIDDVEETRVE